VTAALLTAVAVAGVPPAQAVGETVAVTLTTADGASKLAPQANITLGAVSTGAINVRVNDSLTYQTMVGFGAAFTDSSTFLLNRVKSFNSATYNTLMNDMFNTSTGLGMGFWRVPIGSSDFATTSTHWSDDDVQGPAGNPTQNFGLSAQDTGHIIPVIKDALAINSGLKTVASAWSPPGWMKSNNNMICNTGGVNSTLQSASNQAYADYLRKWIQAYQGQGVPIWALTPINEPLYCPPTYPGMSWTSSGEASWVHTFLKPTLNAAGLSPKLLGYDHNFTNSTFAKDLLASSASGDFGGMAWHCYDNTADPAFMTQTYHVDTAKEVYETECSSDTNPLDIIRFSTPEMALLSAQNYAKGVILWNVALDSSSGPHLGGCSTCVPLVTIDTTVNGSGTVTSATITKRNNYYQFGQISKFVKAGAVRLDSTTRAHGIVTGAFKNPDGQEVLVATNTNSSSTTFTVTWNGAGSFSYTLPSRATVTFRATVPAAPVLSATPTAGHTYRIVTRASGKPVGVDGASTADGGTIVQYTDDGDPDQRWTLANAGSGYFNLINANSGKALDNPAGSTTDGTQMQQFTISGTGNSNQQWQITSAGGGWYTITNRTSGKGLDVRDGSVADAGAIQQWAPGAGNPNQQFKFVPYS
jgi:glucosylceramidase